MFCCHRVKSESPDVFSAEMDKRKLFVKWSKNAIVMSCSVWDIMLEDHKAAKKKMGTMGGNLSVAPKPPNSKGLVAMCK